VCVCVNLTRNLLVKIFEKWLRFVRIMVMSLWPTVLAHSSITKYTDYNSYYCIVSF